METCHFYSENLLFHDIFSSFYLSKFGEMA